MASPTLKFCVSKAPDCTGFLITDRTLAYTVNNITGWNTPNTEISTVTAATISIAKRNDNGTYTTSPLSPISVYPDLPNVESGTRVITAEDAGYGLGSSFADGIYKVTYNVIGDDGVAYSLSAVLYYSHLCAIDCCLQQKALSVSTCNYCCDGLTKKFHDIAMHRRSLKAIEDSINLSLIQKYIDILTELCADCSGCSSGCSGC